MSMRIYLKQLTSLVILAIGTLVGCGENADMTQLDGAQTGGSEAASGAGQDPHDVPLTAKEIEQLKQDTAQYEAAIEHIQQYRATIREKTTTGEPAKAHRALDHLDVVLERLPEAARDSGVSRGRWQKVNETAQTLRDLFNQVHANIDAGDAPNYEAVADEIEQCIQTLAAIEPQAAE